MVEVDIICERCKKPARITAENGKLCLACWREVRKENRAVRQADALAKCFSYKTKEVVTSREAEIINEIMCELESKKSKGL